MFYRFWNTFMHVISKSSESSVDDLWNANQTSIVQFVCMLNFVKKRGTKGTPSKGTLINIQISKKKW